MKCARCEMGRGATTLGGETQVPHCVPCTPPPRLVQPPPGGGTITWPMNNKKSIGNHRRRRRRRKFLVGYTRIQVTVVWCQALCRFWERAVF